MAKIEKHHILFPERIWNQYESGKRLRSNSGLIVLLYSGAHKQIHRKLEQVPLLDTFTLDKVVKEYEPTRNPLHNIYFLQDAIHDALWHDARSSKVAKMLGEVVLEALDLQIPIIREGYVK